MDQCNNEFKPQDQQSKASSPKDERPPSSGSEVPYLKIVYVFAGHRRRADVREHLENLAQSAAFTLDMHEFDLMRDPKHDVLRDEMWSNLKDFIRKLQPFCVIATPQCSTYSRARHFYKVSPGPRPIRSRQYPLGFPWLSQSNRQKAEEGTLLAVRAWELYFLAHEIGATFLGEFPEDLGATNTGVFQCEFGAQTPKPTRFITDLMGFEGPIHSGSPQCNKNWKYQGPLPAQCPHPGSHELSRPAAPAGPSASDGVVESSTKKAKRTEGYMRKWLDSNQMLLGKNRQMQPCSQVLSFGTC